VARHDAAPNLKSRYVKSKIMLDFSLLKTNANFRAIFIARLMSVLGIGMLNVAVPVQIYELTGSSLQVGFAVALDGMGMFVGLMLGGVLADRMDRKWLILASRFILWCGVCTAGIECVPF